MLSPTPTTNDTLPFRTGGFSTLAEGLDYAAQGETGVNFYSPRGELTRVLGYRELRDRARDLASRLVASKLRRGDRVAIIAETNADFLIFFFGCQYAGLVPVPLPLSINFGGRDAYEARLRGMLMAAGARAAVASEELIEALKRRRLAHRRGAGRHAGRVLRAAGVPGRAERRCRRTRPATSSIPRAAPASRAGCW